MSGEQDRLLSRALDRMAHQIRNPLQAVAMNLEVIRIRARKEAPELWSELEPHADAVDENVDLLNVRLGLLLSMARRRQEDREDTQPGRFASDLVAALRLDGEAPRVRVRTPEEESRLLPIRRGRLAELLFRVLTAARTLAGRAGDPELELVVAEEAETTVMELRVPRPEAGGAHGEKDDPWSELSAPRETWEGLAAEAGGGITAEVAGGEIRIRISFRGD